MITAEEAKMNREIYSRSRYGHLMDKYMNAGEYPAPVLSRAEREYIKDVENGRYGHLLDNVPDPLQKMHDSMIRLQNDASERRRQKNEEEQRAELISKGRAQVEKINEKKHADRIQSFADGLIERKRARIEAEAAQRAEEERRAREEQKRIERFRHQIDSLDKTREMTARAEEVMERRKKQELEHKRRMAWFDSQKRG